MKRIVYTRSDGRVAVVQPSLRLIKAFTNGGGLEADRKLRDRWIANDVRGGIPEPVAVKWYQAKAEGGLTEALALGAFRDRDCRNGSDHEVEEGVQRDRFFRDAWRRPNGGGPIFIELEAARPVMVRQVRIAIEDRLEELKKRAFDLLMSGDDAGETALQKQVDALKAFDLRAFATAVRDAKIDSADQLKALWPEELA